MFRASLAHDDATAFFENLGFEFAWMGVHQSFERRLTTDHSVTYFFDAAWAKRICLSGKAERRCGAFVGFEQRTRRPIGTNGFALRQALIDRLESLPGDIRQRRDDF